MRFHDVSHNIDIYISHNVHTGNNGIANGAMILD